jgi:hypothetical protein
MGQQSAGGIAFANGLRKNVLANGNRWTAWPGGANALATIVACIEDRRLRLTATLASNDADPDVATCIADLRAILEWTTYQSGALKTAQAITVARKTRRLAERIGIVTQSATPGSIIGNDSEESLMENVRTRNGYLRALAARTPHIAFPEPIIEADALIPKRTATPPSKLALIQKLKKP